jgi:nucleotide-binding universal stress UspA family protein
MSAPLRILIPDDGSDPAHRAVAHVVSLAARGLSIDVHLLNVQSAVRRSAASLVPARDLEDYHRDEGMRALAESIRQIEAAGLKPHSHVCVGDPGESILTFAERLQCEQIVMGTRGHGIVGTLLLGSVAQHVVAHSKLPVTLVR